MVSNTLMEYEYSHVSLRFQLERVIAVFTIYSSGPSQLCFAFVHLVVNAFLLRCQVTEICDRVAKEPHEANKPCGKWMEMDGRSWGNVSEINVMIRAFVSRKKWWIV